MTESGLKVVDSFWWNVLIYLPVPSGGVLETTPASRVLGDLRSVRKMRCDFNRILFFCEVVSIPCVPCIFYFLLMMDNFIPWWGVRLYFSTCPFRQPLARPNTLTLVHVRLPPGFSASSTVEKPSKVHKALYSKGKFWNTVRWNIRCLKFLKLDCLVRHLKITRKLPIKFRKFWIFLSVSF